MSVGRSNHSNWQLTQTDKPWSKWMAKPLKSIIILLYILFAIIISWQASKVWHHETLKYLVKLDSHERGLSTNLQTVCNRRLLFDTRNEATALLDPKFPLLMSEINGSNVCLIAVWHLMVYCFCMDEISSSSPFLAAAPHQLLDQKASFW